jgi:hypothetical protein
MVRTILRKNIRTCSFGSGYPPTVDAIKGREVFREDSLIALGEFSVEGVSECEMIVVCLGSCPY